MKTRFLLILFAAILTLCISSCKNPTEDIEKTENPPVSESGDKEQTDIPDISDDTDSEKDKAEDSEKHNEEVINDSVTDNESTTDAYSYVAETGFEIAGELGSSEFAIYTTDGEHYGICGIDGKVVVEPEFNLIGWCPWHEVVYAEPFAEGREPIIISDKYKIDVHYGHGGFGKAFYIYDCNTEKMYLASTDIELFVLEETETVPADTPYICYNGGTPLSEGEFYPGDESAELYYTIENLAFGSAEYEYMTSRGSIVNLGECEIADGFTNDYMMVKKDGRIGFVDLAGNKACEFIYTDALRAFDAKAWVKTEDGIWKVVNLK